MTRQDLLKDALERIEHGNATYWVQEPEVAKCAFLSAIASTLLAQELRKDEERQYIAGMYGGGNKDEQR